MPFVPKSPYFDHRYGENCLGLWNKLHAYYSGLVLELGFLVENMMVTLCWAQKNVEGLIRAIKFVELAASNMLAITNLAICINLAAIVLVSSG